MIELKACACSVDEQETTIQISRDGKEIHLWTCDNTRLTKMQKLINAPGSLWKLTETTYNKNGEPTGYSFVCSDKRMISLKPKMAERAQKTEEEKQAARERMIKLRSEGRL